MVRLDCSGTDCLVQVRDLDKKYHRGNEVIDVLRGTNLDVARGEFVAFMGPSGSGKTTLLNLVGGLDEPTSGTIAIDGREINSLSRKELTRFRSQYIGFIFQMYNLIPVLTSFQNVQLPLLLTGLSRSERVKHVEAALDIVELSGRMKHYPSQLSGGEAQRVAIARAIVTDPVLLLCDEPTGDLDRQTGDGILELLKRLSKEFGKTILMVTHDPRAAAIADTILHLEKGVLVEAQHPGEVS
ncbi:MAG: ABC transporter ATP-binding protein [Candidatus Krumholzibacteria bacterium]|jgi:putative ABC transport system ATP-binding protein|nr:ABC transporter ATP-binding protein [Candidatus Krumholzibacteria bacterium]